MNQSSNNSMIKYMEITGCIYTKEAILVTPCSQTPNHTLYLSSLDIYSINFPVGCLFLFKKSTCIESLKLSLSRILVDYYPLAGRLRNSKEDRIEIDCNGKGVLIAEGFLNSSAKEFLEGSKWPNRSWKKLLYHVDATDPFGVPPVVIQVIRLNCGGMILLTSVSHALCDGMGTSQFLNAWAQITQNPNSNILTTPFHSRHLLKPQTTTIITYNDHLEHKVDPTSDLLQSILSQPLVQVSVTFTASQILSLKKQVDPSLKCTSFEVLASHVWRTWAKSRDFPTSLDVKLIFMVDARNKLDPNLPKGYYGNAAVAVYAESTVEKLATSNLQYGVELVTRAKEKVNDGYIRTVINIFDAKSVKVGLSANLAIAPWCKLGFEDVDFGNGKPLHIGPLENTACCLLPVVGDLHAITVLVAVPERVAEKFELLLRTVGEMNYAL